MAGGRGVADGGYWGVALVRRGQGLAWSLAGRHSLHKGRIQLSLSARDLPDHQRGADAVGVVVPEMTLRVAMPGCCTLNFCSLARSLGS